MNKRKPTLCIVIPCYNEQEVLPITAPIFKEKIINLIEMDKIGLDSKVLFVDDGSKDFTWDLIKDFSEKEDFYIGIRQSKNRGHQNAVLAGLMEAREEFDFTISIDCDGQDDINAMDEMVDAYLKGIHVVYGVRSSRKSDTFFKRFSAQSFYKILKRMDVDVVYNHADYRLISRQVLKAFADFKEVNLFLRGLIPLVGFESSVVYYERNERLAGEGHYPLKKMLGLAFDGITSLSIKPIRVITFLGLIVASFSFIGAFWSFIMYISKETVSGWASMTIALFFVSGIQLICLGVIGEYIGKIYLETKQRPRYIISERVGFVKRNYHETFR